MPSVNDDPDPWEISKLETKQINMITVKTNQYDLSQNKSIQSQTKQINMISDKTKQINMISVKTNQYDLRQNKST